MYGLRSLLWQKEVGVVDRSPIKNANDLTSITSNKMGHGHCCCWLKALGHPQCKVLRPLLYPWDHALYTADSNA